MANENEVIPAPAATPDAAPAAAPAVDPVKKHTLSSILGFVNPEDKEVTPPVEPAKPDPAPAAETPAPEAPPVEKPKPVTVKKRPAVADEVRRVIREEKAVTPTLPPPVAPVHTPAPNAPDPFESTLGEAEREELEMARYMETKDPKKAGTADRLKEFYKKQQKFLDDAISKASEHGDEYDPNADPKFRKFVADNMPISAADRKRFGQEKLLDVAEERAATKIRAELSPKHEALERELNEMKQRPVVKARLDKYAGELVESMDPEVVKFFHENGRDTAKVEAQFPMEYEIIKATVRGAHSLATELKNVKAGLTPFDPAKNKNHKYLADFVQRMGDEFERYDGPEKVRDGKQYIHPAKFTPAHADRYFTLGDEDILEMLRVEAANEANGAIAKRRKQLEQAGYARAPKAAAPVAPVTPPVASPRTPPAPKGQVASPSEPAPAKNSMSALLGLG